MAAGSFITDVGYLTIIDDGIGRKIHLGDGCQVYIFVLAKLMRVTTKQLHDAHHHAHELTRNGLVVQPGRAEWRQIVQIGGSRVTCQVEGPYGSLVAGDVIRVVIAADRVKGYDHIRFEAANVAGNFHGYLLKRLGDQARAGFDYRRNRACPNRGS